MEVNIRKIFGLVLMIILLSLIFSGKVFASEASNLRVSPNSCKAKENFTVSVDIPKDVVAYQFDVIIDYGETSDIKHIKRYGLEPNNYTDLKWAGNFSEDFTALIAGNPTISITNITLSNIDYQKVNEIPDLGPISINITDSTPTPPASNNSSQPDDSTPPPAEVVVVNFKDVNEIMYVTEKVNMRQNCGTDTGKIRTLEPGTEITRTGIGDKSKDGYSWSRISYNGETGYVITGRLTYDKPEEKPPENTVANNTVSNNEITNNTVSNNSVLNGIKNIADELGAIPEVGLNIMTFIFVGSCIVCSIIIIYVKRKIAK